LPGAQFELSRDLPVRNRQGQLATQSQGRLLSALRNKEDFARLFLEAMIRAAVTEFWGAHHLKADFPAHNLEAADEAAVWSKGFMVMKSEISATPLSPRKRVNKIFVSGKYRCALLNSPAAGAI
jgi:hypothetical protein